MDDIFENAPVPAQELITAGRYNVLDPYTLRPRRWTRVTNFAKTISDSYTLSQWSQRMVLKGASKRPDLIRRAAELDVRDDREELNRIVEQAKNAAGAKDAADKGTSIHTFAEETDAGRMRIEDVPKDLRDDVRAYRRALARSGLRVLPDLQEAVTCVPGFGVAGRLDKVIEEPDGSFRIGDVKSGQKLLYNQLEIAVQLAVYAHGLNECGMYDPQTKTWSKDVPHVETDYALVLHVPSGSGTCEPYTVDIETGWEAAQLCMDVRARRKIKGLIEPYEPLIKLPSWEQRFRSVRTRPEASALYADALSELGLGQRLDDLVRLGIEALKEV